MPTRLDKPVKRELYSTDRRGRTLIIEVEPPDLITFRLKGKRTRVSIALSHCYQLAQIMDMEYRYTKAMERYKALKKAGAKVRRPKRPAQLWSKVYYKALGK